MTVQSKTFFNRSCASLFFATFLSACGSKTSNTNIPKSAGDLSIDDVADTGVRAANQRWNELARELKLTNDGSSDALKTPSEYFGTSPANENAFATLTDKIAAKHLETARTTGCAGIDSFERIGNAQTLDFAVGFPQPLDAADWYLMKYRRKKSDGTADTLVHGALVSVPTATGNQYPVVLYAHAGDRGLSALEVSAVFGNLQSSHIIVAPAFPGEPICKFLTSSASKTSCDATGAHFDAVGVSDPYGTDAEDLLAAHNCLVTPNALPNYSSTVISKIKTQTPAGLSVGTVPVSYIMGSSRGGMTAHIALAKNTSMLLANRSAGSTLYNEAKYFNCLATNINPTNFTYKEFRVFLEAIVKGTSAAMDASTLPTAPQLIELMKDYTEGRMSAADAALLLQLRDATFNSKLSLASVRKWSDGGKGAFLSVHATLDKRIPISQGIFGASVFSSINSAMISRHQSDATLPAGLNMTTLGTNVTARYSTDGGRTLNPNYTMHGDFAWFDSLGAVNTATNFGETPSALEASSPYLNKKPTEILAAWLANSTTGCTASTPQ